MEKIGNIIFLKKPTLENLSSPAPWSYPHQVVNDPALKLEEKRALLAAWASDAYAVESLPVLWRLPGTPFLVTFSSIMDAMARLDRMEEDDDPPPPAEMKAGRPPPARSRLI
jgi:hypothetical protein